MDDSVALSSGIYIPRAVMQRDLKASAASAALPRVDATGAIQNSGRWQRLGAVMGDGSTNTYPIDRRRAYASYLNTIQTIPWVWQVGSTVAWAYAETKFNIVSGRGETPIPVTDPDLNDLLDLLDQPNPYQDWVHLKGLLAWHYQLTGNAFLIMDNRDGLGRPRELYLANPAHMLIAPDPKTYIRGYWYEVGGTYVPFNPDEVVWFKEPNPADQYWGIGRIQAGQLAFDKQRGIAQTESNFFNHGARVKGVLTYDGVLSEEAESELRAAWRAMDEGGRGSLRTAILQAGMKYQGISSDLVANGPGMEALAKMSRDEILSLFGVPREMIGIFEGTSATTSIEAQQYFQASTMRPMLRATNEGWTRVARCYKSTFRFRHDEMVVTDYAGKATTAHYFAQSASLTRNEIRVLSGLEAMPEDDPRGTEIVGPTSMTVFEVGGPVQEQLQANPGTGANQPPENVPAQGRAQNRAQGRAEGRTQGRAAAAAASSSSASSSAADGTPGKAAGAAARTLRIVKSRPVPDTPPEGPLESACACPLPLAVTLTSRAQHAAEVGVCPLHVDEAERVLSEGRRRSYSLEQLTNGYDREALPGYPHYPGLRGVLAQR